MLRKLRLRQKNSFLIKKTCLLNTRKRSICSNFTIKTPNDVFDVLLVSLLLTLNIFYAFFKVFLLLTLRNWKLNSKTVPEHHSNIFVLSRKLHLFRKKKIDSFLQEQVRMFHRVILKSVFWQEKLLTPMEVSDLRN